MRKFKLYWDKDREEQWLNEMADIGWGMTKFFLGLYTFEPCKAGEYQYRIDFPGNSLNDEERREYIGFVEDTGAEYVSQWMVWIYFRKETTKGRFEIYSDYESKIMVYTRIHSFLKKLLALELLALVINIPSIWMGSIFNLFLALVLLLPIMVVISVVLKRTASKIRELEREKELSNG